ncbi:MAG: protein-L-isoaspartate O-methyltransferase [Gammaproteobacteria bacterium]|nr:protein-L-isoaspartate O-methyltransferase [Gammaproteobacteria bacterium]
MLEINLEEARRQMVDQQVHGFQVLDPDVIRVMETVPRHDYAPERYRNLVYADSTIPIGHGEVMLAPGMHGRFLQAIELKEGERVLEIGTGSGYLTACLAALGGRVRSVDIHEDFIREAGARLEKGGFGGVELACEDAHVLEDGDTTWDVIVVTGSLPLREESFPRRLAGGGRLLWIVGEPPAMLVELVTRVGEEEWQQEGQFETVVPALRGTERPRRFEF